MPKDCINTINEFLNTCSLKYKDVHLGQVVNMDVTSFSVDSPSYYTIKGSLTELKQQPLDMSEQDYQLLYLPPQMEQSFLFLLFYPDKLN